MGNIPSSNSSSSSHHNGSSSSSSSNNHRTNLSSASSPSTGVSSSSRNEISLPRFGRSTGVLGLSRSELDQRCKPSGLYHSTPWEEKAIRRLIGDGAIAARFRGTENRVNSCDRECPICFLYYNRLNVTSCCGGLICSECYLQIRPQKNKKSPTECPFCTSECFSVSILNTLKQGNSKEAFMEENDGHDEEILFQGTTSGSKPLVEEGGFGSTLERHVMLRSNSSSLDNNNCTMFAISAAERKLLEDEMKAQHQHPLSRQIEREAQDRREEHERSFLQRNSGRRPRTVSAASFLHRSLLNSTSRGRGRRNRNDLNQIVQSFGNSHTNNGNDGSAGEGMQSLDDLVVFEAALLLSMEEEARRSRSTNTNANANESSGTQGQESRSGFPLLHALMDRRSQEEDVEGSNSIRRRGTAAEALRTLLMRGMSEEEQIAFAVAMSLREQTNTNNETQTTEQDDGNDNNAQVLTDGVARAVSSEHTNTSNEADTTIQES